MRAAAVLGLALLAAGAAAMAADGMPVDADGWYRWQVPAGGQGQQACCYRMHGGSLSQIGCSLEGGEPDAGASRDCDISSDRMQVFAKVREGQVRDIRAFSGGCPVNAGATVHELGAIPTARSIGWLMGALDSNPSLADEALMAISLHSDVQALEALSGVLEDRGRAMETREHALFWLVQSDSDAAYAYLDRLLSPVPVAAD